MTSSTIKQFQLRSVTPASISEDIENNNLTSFVRPTSNNTSSTSSWRSSGSGWTPLVYPTSALYHYNKNSYRKKIDDESSDESNSNNNDENTNDETRNNSTAKNMMSIHNDSKSNYGNISASGGHWELNPYFPLHRDVVLAATRELLILDGSLNPKTLEVIPPMTKSKPKSKIKPMVVDDDIKNKNVNQPDGTKAISKTTITTIPTTTTTTTCTKPAKNKRTNSTTRSSTKNIIVVGEKFNTINEKTTSNGSCVITTTSTQRKNVKRKRVMNNANSITPSSFLEIPAHIPFVEHLRQHKRTKLGNSNTIVSTMRPIDAQIVDKEEDDPTNETCQSSSPSFNETLLGEDLANAILKQFVWDLQNCDEEHGNSEQNDNSNVPRFIRLSTTSTTDDIEQHHNQQRHQANSTHEIGLGTDKESKSNTSVMRPRKVSDVDDCTFVSTYTSLPANISPHLAVVAINQDKPGENIIHSVQRLINEHPTSNNNLGTRFYHNTNNHEAILLEHKNDLPPLLDISIMVESHLRRSAYQMIQRLTSHFDEKTKREFLGYRSAALKKDRIMHLMSDFLFDVSHAMFAWDQTEAETFGTDAYPNTTNIPNHTTPSSALDEKSLMMRDKKLCNILFDHKALRKIGGFDPSSLLYHAVSMKRLRTKQKTWIDLAKSPVGKKMFRHHFDDQARVQVGQIRRGQRIRKSRFVFHHPMMTSNDKHMKSRSRSSSIASDDSETRNVTDCHPLNNIVEDENSVQIANIVPDSLLITVSRQDTSKSWGILLAKEGSMCIVMRASNEGKEKSDETCQNASLQRGDLIVSFRNERNETLIPTEDNEGVSYDWFNEAVSLFKRSCTLHLNVRRVPCASKYH